MSMIKLTYSSDINSAVGVGGEIVKSASELGKQASTIFHMEYDELKPPKGMTGIHLVALGDSEAYPMNRNGDLFPKEACVKYHPTFVKHGCVYQHHRNKDPKTQGIGQIKASAYNPDMHRIELYIWADNEKAHDHLERLEKTGEVSFSMACVRAGTPIMTIGGMKAVEDIKEGDVVLTHLGNWKRVSKTMSREADEYCKVSFVSWGNRVLEITPNHQVYAASFDDIPRGIRKDRIAHPENGWRRRHRDVLCKYAKWMPAADLTKYHYMCVPMWNDVPGGIGIDRARLYGYYIADGSLAAGVTQITCRSGGGAYSEVEKLANWTSTKKKQHTNSDKCVEIKLFGTAIRNELESACGRRCENKRIPDVIRMGSIEEKFNFMAAWFNSDGWQDKTGLHWSIHPRNLANDLQVLLASVGVPSSCTKILHKEDRGVVKSKDPVEYVVSVSNENSGLFSDISKANDISIDGPSKMRTFVSGRYLFVPVSSVETVKKTTKVYNFSVDDDESYTVFGLAVHNCRVPYDKCCACGAIRKKPGGPGECDHIKYGLGKIAEDGTQYGTINEKPTWFDISFVGRPADRIAWNMKVASSMPEELTINSSVKQAQIEGYTLPDDLAIESDLAKRKLGFMKKLAEAYSKCESWLSGETRPSGKDKYRFELRKLAGAKVDDGLLMKLREYDPSAAFNALGDAGIVMDTASFFKYAFGPDYGIVEKYVPFVEKTAASVIREAVDTSSCADFCNDSRFDASPSGIPLLHVPRGLAMNLLKSAAAMGFGTNDAVTSVLETVASGEEPSFGSSVSEKSAEDVDDAVVRKLARKYAMYKVAALCAVMDGRFGGELDEDDVVFVSAAQDLKNS